MKKLELCPKCGTRPGLRLVGDNKQFIILCCPECGYTAAKNGEARGTLRGAVRVWNKAVKNADRRTDHG